MTLAILCSGQGAQHPGMFSLTGDSRAAAPLFECARSLLGGIDPRALALDAEAAYANRAGQVLCTLQPLATQAMLGDRLPEKRIVAGYSVGEIAAWSLADLLTPKQVLDLAARRAEVMDAASRPGEGLLFVRGLARAPIDRLCARHGAAVAIVNPGEAFVLGGAGRDLDALAEQALSEGAVRAMRLGVAVASHTPRLASAAQAFRQVLDEVTVQPRVPAGVRLLSGIDAAPVFRVREGLDKLAGQIAQTVRWADCLAACLEAGASAFLELGPGRALAEMVAVMSPAVPSRSLDDFRTLEGLSAWLAQAGR